MDQNIRSDQDNSDGNLRNKSDEVSSTSFSSTSNVDVKVMNPQQIRSNNINEEYCKNEKYCKKNPVKKNDDLIMDFDRSNAEFRRALVQNERRKESNVTGQQQDLSRNFCIDSIVKFGYEIFLEANYVRNPMELYDSEPVYEVIYGNSCNNPFDYPPNDGKKRRFTIIEYLYEDDENSDASTDSRTSDDDASDYIQDFVIYVTSEVYLLDCSRIVKCKLQNILHVSHKKCLTTQLMDAAQKLLEPLNHKSDYVGILLNIIVNVCKNDDKAILSIGDNVTFTKIILSHLKSVDDMVLLNLLKLLQFAVSEIQKDPGSRWLNYLKECDSFGHCISVILKFPYLDDTLVIIAIELLKEIAKISLPNQPNFLHQLVNLHDFIPVLMTCCSRRIMSRTNKYSPRDLHFLYNWLSIIMTVEADLIITFEENEEKEKHILLKILFNILYMYAYQADIFSLKQEVKQHVDMLFKSISLLSCLYRRFFVPTIMDRILTKIILNLAEVLDLKIRITSKEERTSSDTLLLKFSRYLDEIWLSIMQHRDILSILILMKQLDEEGQQYFMNLGYFDPQIQYKMKKVHANLKRQRIIKRVSND